MISALVYAASLARASSRAQLAAAMAADPELEAYTRGCVVQIAAYTCGIANMQARRSNTYTRDGEHTPISLFDQRARIS